MRCTAMNAHFVRPSTAAVRYIGSRELVISYTGMCSCCVHRSNPQASWTGSTGPRATDWCQVLVQARGAGLLIALDRSALGRVAQMSFIFLRLVRSRAGVAGCVALLFVSQNVGVGVAHGNGCVVCMVMVMVQHQLRPGC